MIPSLEISLLPARQRLPVLDEAVLEKIAEDFQARMLGYRLANFSKVLNSTFDAPALTPSLRELARNLSACTSDDPELRAQVPEFLCAQDKEMRSAAWLDLNNIIIEALLAFIHEAKEHSVYVGEIAGAVETILGDRGEERKLEPRAIGARLEALGLITEPRDRKGIRLVLSADVSRRVHELAHHFSVPSVRDGMKRCD